MFANTHIDASRRSKLSPTNSRINGALLSAVLSALSFMTPVSADEPASNSLSSRLVAQGYRQLSSGSYTSAIQTLTAALKSDPSSALARRYLAHALLRSGQGAKAALQFEQLVKLPQPMPADQSGLGDALMSAGNAEKAMVAYQSALRLDPNHEPARSGMVHACLSLGKKDAAASLCREVLKRSRNPDVRSYYQKLLQDLEKPQEDSSGNERDDRPAAETHG